MASEAQSEQRCCYIEVQRTSTSSSEEPHAAPYIPMFKASCLDMRFTIEFSVSVSSSEPLRIPPRCLKRAIKLSASKHDTEPILRSGDLGVSGGRITAEARQLQPHHPDAITVVYITICRILVCAYVCIDIYIQLYTYIHTYIHTYVHTYIHTYISDISAFLKTLHPSPLTLKLNPKRKP